MSDPPVITAVALDRPDATYTRGGRAALSITYIPGTSDETLTGTALRQSPGGGAGPVTVTIHEIITAPDTTVTSVTDSAGTLWRLDNDTPGPGGEQTAVWSADVAAPGTLTITVTDPVTGQTATTQVAYAARAVPLPGYCARTSEWALNAALLGPSPTHRVFYTQLPVKFSPLGTPPGTTLIVSYKTASTNVGAYFGSVPAEYQVWGCWHHEPEPEVDPAVFCATTAAQAGLIRAANPAVKIVMISAGYAYRAGATGPATKGAYFAGLGDIIDVWGLDQYQGRGGWPGDGKTNYDWSVHGLADSVPFQTRLRLLADPAVVGTVRPWAVTEYGVAQLVGAERRRERIAADVAYLRTLPAGQPVCWSYWQVPPKSDETDMRLLPGDDAALWKAVMTGAV